MPYVLIQNIHTENDTFQSIMVFLSLDPFKRIENIIERLKNAEGITVFQ